MYTLCWAGNGTEGWDRFPTKEELERFIKSLIDDGFSNEDMLVYSPNVDYIVPSEDGTI
ncbi:MAG: hypothetical protein M0Q88_08030 [Bacilli bacterium]|nr:hypothetical protein [Bacilli bacterium]